MTALTLGDLRVEGSRLHARGLGSMSLWTITDMEAPGRLSETAALTRVPGKAKTKTA